MLYRIDIASFFCIDCTYLIQVCRTRHDSVLLKHAVLDGALLSIVGSLY
ncbi:MAG: hypothetical protein SOU07_06655 [Bacilli bacterium]|nr:hypothetical protein [Bacilli bacterium]